MTRFALIVLAIVVTSSIVAPTRAEQQAQRVVQTPPPAPMEGQVTDPTQATQSLPPVLQMVTPQTRDRVVAIRRARRAGLHYVPGDVIFKFKSGVSSAAKQQALTALRSRPSLADVRWIGDVGVIHDDSQPDGTVLAAQLRDQSEIEYAAANYFRSATPATSSVVGSVTTANASSATARPAAVSPFTPNDPDYGLYQWNFQAIGMPDAWGLTPGGSSSITVAVIDTGVTTTSGTVITPVFNSSSFVRIPIAFATSPDITTGRLVRAKSYIVDISNAVTDFDGHGTHVASTIGEDTNNGFAVAGMAFNVRLMPLKVCASYWDEIFENGLLHITDPPDVAPGESTCDDGAIIQALHDAADAGAKVINMSLGGPDPDDALRDALTYAVGKGAFVAIAMGNDFTNGNPTEYPAFYAAQINGAMSVAAVGRSLKHASYSSSGSYCEIAAPGGATDDGFGAQGLVVQVTLNPTDKTPQLGVPRFDRYVEVGLAGTSMATPHVSGLAALIISQYPGITPAAVEALIKNTARDLGPTGRDDLFGNGLIQPRAALFGLGIAK
jgi:subtilisin family serine protease